MAVATREQLKQYALRALGAPVLEVNVDDDQLEDRIDEALEYWRINHHEGVEKAYVKHKLQASSLYLSTNDADRFEYDAIITGVTSGATARVIKEQDKTPAANEILVRAVDGEFVAGETITTEINTVTVTGQLAATNFITLREFDLKYLQLTDWVYGVTRMLPFSGTQTSKSMFDIQYQLRLNDLYDLTSTSIIYYKMTMAHLSLLDMELNGKPMFDFNRMQGRVYPRINWDSDITPGDYVILECYRAIDPAQFVKVWSEPWLKHYVTALFKKQWATNLKKFSGLQLPGGVSLDGQGLYDEAVGEIKELEEELMTKSAPLEFFMG